MPALIDDPALLDRILRTFRIKGRVRPFELSETAIPTFDIGNLGGLDPTVVTTNAGSTGVRIGTLNDSAGLQTNTAHFARAEITDGAVAINPAAGTVLVDTGQLAQQNHLVEAVVSSNVPVDFRLEWRNAADAATVASWTVLCGGPSAVPHVFGPWNLEDVLLNERFRVVNVSVVAGSVATAIHAGPLFAATAT